MAIYAATHCGCKVNTTTISDAQYTYAKDEVKRLNPDHKITVINKDYRFY
ncbi:MAG: cyclopropane-fatty-acyl-phospholipid synthase [Flavobacteriales bacterium]|jgi:cyclopropane-fatty-acyl-phospholipid synthase